MARWYNKPVSFNLDDDADAELCEYARGMDNFTAAVKRWLRGVREGANVPSREFTQVSREVTQTDESGDQFLL